jgi:hypothetical protein
MPKQNAHALLRAQREKNILDRELYRSIVWSPPSQPEALCRASFPYSSFEAKKIEMAQPMSPRWTQEKASSVPSVA